MKIVKFLILATIAFSLGSCAEDNFDVVNAGVITGNQVDELKNDSASSIKIAESLNLGIYSYMNNYVGHDNFGYTSMFHLADVMNDDLALAASDNGWFFYDYQLRYWGENLVKPYAYWQFYYTLIAKANSLILALPLDTKIAGVQSILGQAYAFRGMALFNIAQFYQQTYVGNENKPGVPIIRVGAKEAASDLSRSTLADVYKQIDADFLKSMEYFDASKEVRTNKIYINKNVAAGLYSRVCLVKEDWPNAIKYAKMAREGQYILTPTEMASEGYNNINSKEWMWGSDITSTTSTAFGSFFSFVCSYDAGYGGDIGGYCKIDALLYDNTLTPTDARRKWFKVTGTPGVTYTAKERSFPDYANIKFKLVPNWEADYVFMRTPEMVLTEAEALARSGNTIGAATVLKELMVNRDPNWSRTSVTADEVYQQRRLELWGEGFSHYDHLRLKKGIDRSYAGTNHMAAFQYKIAAENWYLLYQLPKSEFNANKALSYPADQNPVPTGSKY